MDLFSTKQGEILEAVLEAFEYVSYCCKDIPDHATMIPEDKNISNLRNIKKVANQALKFAKLKGSKIMSNDQEIENKIQEKGLNAPRLTPALIDSVIVKNQYHVFEGSCLTLTVCCLTLKNGFTVTGESACASPENFDAEIGKEIAFNNAKQKIWALEGYLLKDKLSKASE